jgi:hypothetical protein
LGSDNISVGKSISTGNEGPARTGTTIVISVGSRKSGNPSTRKTWRTDILFCFQKDFLDSFPSFPIANPSHPIILPGPSRQENPATSKLPSEAFLEPRISTHALSLDQPSSDLTDSYQSDLDLDLKAMLKGFREILDQSLKIITGYLTLC